jgi:hypothetical protein
VGWVRIPAGVLITIISCTLALATGIGSPSGSAINAGCSHAFKPPEIARIKF